MKYLVVEGLFESQIIDCLFPDLTIKGVTLRVASGFSNTLAFTKSLVDYGFEVLTIIDTDTNIPDNDNREILNRIRSIGYIRNAIKIVWMDPCMANVVRKVIPDFPDDIEKGFSVIQLSRKINKYKNDILKLNEFRIISDFCKKG